MSEKWVDERITTRPSRTPEQRRTDAQEAEADAVKLDRVGLAILKRRIAEQNERLDMLLDLIEQQQTGARGQARRLDGYEKGIETLRSQTHELLTAMQPAIASVTKELDEREDGTHRLERRIDKLEWWRDQQHTINQDIYRQMRSGYDKLDLARMKGDDAMNQRIQARAIELEHRIEERLDNHQARLNRLEAQAKRVRGHFPQVAEPTIQERCAASWPREEDLDLDFGEGALAPGEIL